MPLYTIKLPDISIREPFVSINYDFYYPATGDSLAGYNWAYVNVFLKESERILYAKGRSIEGHYYSYCKHCEKLELGLCPGGTVTLEKNKCSVISISQIGEETISIPKKLLPSMFRHSVAGNSKPEWYMVRETESTIEIVPYRLGNVYDNGTVCMGSARRNSQDIGATIEAMFSASWNRDVIPDNRYRNKVSEWVRIHSPEVQATVYPDKKLPWKDASMYILPSNDDIVKEQNDSVDSDVKVFRTTTSTIPTIDYVSYLDVSTMTPSNLQENFPFHIVDKPDIERYYKNYTIWFFIDRQNQKVYCQNDTVELTFAELEEKGYVFRF